MYVCVLDIVCIAGKFQLSMDLNAHVTLMRMLSSVYLKFFAILFVYIMQ